MRAIYSLDEQSFVDEIPEHYPYGYVLESLNNSILVLYCEGEEPLELNNWEPYSAIVLDRFRDFQQDFMMHLDFFVEDNMHYLTNLQRCMLLNSDGKLTNKILDKEGFL